MQPAGPLDEVFVGRSTSGPAYQVAVARDDNIVVVLESTGADFPAVQALETVLAHGIRGAAGRCTAVLTGSGTRCRSTRPGVAHRPYRLAPDPALDLNSWSVAGIDPRPDEVHARRHARLPRPTAGLGSEGVWASTVQTQYPYTDTWVNEYVLDGGTADRAATMFDALVEQWRTCRAGRSHPFPLETDPEVLGSGFDDLFQRHRPWPLHPGHRPRRERRGAHRGQRLRRPIRSHPADGDGPRHHPATIARGLGDWPAGGAIGVPGTSGWDGPTEDIRTLGSARSARTSLGRCHRTDARARHAFPRKRLRPTTRGSAASPASPGGAAAF